jgi:ABC-2 type transport system ATP-binding protein
MTAVLQVDSLRKEFGELTAVADISFEVLEGEIFGFLGPNGAGKTTSISMICGLLKPTAGEIFVCGKSVLSHPREVKAMMGVVPQEVAIYEELSARENLVFWGGIFGLKGKALNTRVDKLLEQVGLDDRAKEPTKNFSGGMKRRLNLAMGLINEPRLILLDEPTVGIDPQARIKILDVVKAIVAEGRTVIYTTHYLEEAEELCDRVAIIDHGKILSLGTVPELQTQLGEGSLLTVQGSFSGRSLTEAVDGVEGLRPIEIEEGRAMLLVTTEGPGISHCLESLFSKGMTFDDITIKEPNLEDLFLKLTGRELRN